MSYPEVIAVHIAVLIVGILGSLGAGALAGFYLLTQSASEFYFKGMTRKTTGEAISEGLDPTTLHPLWKMTTVQEWIDGCHWQSLCIWFLLGAFVVGLIGSILGFTKHGFSAAMLLFAAFAAPLVIYPGVMTTIFPSLLLVAGTLALFVKPTQHAPGTSEPR